MLYIMFNNQIHGFCHVTNKVKYSPCWTCSCQQNSRMLFTRCTSSGTMFIKPKYLCCTCTRQQCIRKLFTQDLLPVVSCCKAKCPLLHYALASSKGKCTSQVVLPVVPNAFCWTYTCQQNNIH